MKRSENFSFTIDIICILCCVQSAACIYVYMTIRLYALCYIMLDASLICVIVAPRSYISSKETICLSLIFFPPDAATKGNISISIPFNYNIYVAIRFIFFSPFRFLSSHTLYT